MDQCFQDPQSQLADAIAQKDIKKFHNAILAGADADLVSKNGMSVFEFLCGQPNSAEFILECIKNGSQLNHPNEKLEKYPIHFACESLDLGNVEAIASSMVKQGVDLNVKYYGQTALVQVTSKINKENVGKCCQIVKVLIKNGADVNVPDPKDQTPILLLLKKISSGEQEVRDAVKFILQNCTVDLDTYRNGEARKKLKEKCPDFEGFIHDTKEISLPLLESHLKNRREQAFIQDLGKVLELNGTNNVNELNSTFLETAIEEGLSHAVKELVTRGVNVNQFKHGTMSPIKLAAVRGNVEILETLLQSPDIQLSDADKNPIMITIIKGLSDGNDRDRDRYQKCFDMLIDHPDLDVNEKDITENTALHFACRYRNKEVTRALLEKKAYIGVKNAMNSIAIDDIDPEVLERHFDSCISTNHSRIGDDDFEIILDFSNFSPVDNEKAFKGAKQFNEEIEPLIVIAKTKELKHLMTHPLITSFLFIKWHRLFSLFLVNLILYSIFCISLVVYVVFFYGNSEPTALSNLFIFLTAAGLLVVILREALQFILSPIKYIKLLENYLEIGLIIMTIVVLITNYENEYSSRTRMFASITILLAATEMSLLISSLPNSFISTHLVMLKRVSSSFMKSLSINSVIILAFAFCFYTLFNVKESPNTKGNNATEENGESKFNSFVDPGTAIIKTIVMMTGEFEAASIDFDVNQSSYFIFLLFVFFMSIVLFNLLNGLAVSDTQVIKAEAEQCHFIEKACTLHRFEKSVLSKDFSFLPRLQDSNFLRTKIYTVICVFPHFLPQKKIIIYPNAGNRIKVQMLRPKADYNGTDTSVLIDSLIEKRDLAGTNKICFCQPCVGHCSRMDRKIVKQLMQCIERRRRTEEEENEKNFLQQKILNIEMKLTQMESVYTEILNLLKNKA